MSAHDSEWAGEPHTLIVRQVHLPHGPLDNGCLDCTLEHPASCTKETTGDGEHSYTQYTCDVAHQERESGLASSLRYSGTPVTEPGTYQIQGWGRKSYYHESGTYEYDNGVGLINPEEQAAP